MRTSQLEPSNKTSGELQLISEKERSIQYSNSSSDWCSPAGTMPAWLSLRGLVKSYCSTSNHKAMSRRGITWRENRTIDSSCKWTPKRLISTCKRLAMQIRMVFPTLTTNLVPSILQFCVSTPWTTWNLEKLCQLRSMSRIFGLKIRKGLVKLRRVWGKAKSRWWRK